MHISPSAWIVLSTALLPRTVKAFYPYHFGNDDTAPQSRRTVPAPHEGSLSLPLRRVPTLHTRQNGFNILNSADPKQANSVAIDQDGGDLSYMVAVTIGDSKEEYHLLLDSAASNTWVMGQDCSSAACKTHNTFGKGDSGSLKTQPAPFSITYGTGSVSGTLATDTLHIGSLSSPLTFGLATNVSDEFNAYPMDGILGIGRGAKVAGSIDAPQLMEVLATNKLVTAKMYGIHLSRAADGTNDGELDVGSVNKDRFTGDLSWSDIVDNDTGFWEIPIDNAGVNGQKLGLTGRTAIVDTGTSFILMPPADAVKIHGTIPGYKQDGETFSVPCDTSAVVQFTFNKQTYNISTSDWRGGKLDTGLCRSNIVGRQTFGASQWLVGDVFLKNVYAVLDFDGKRVGLGVKSVTASTSSSTGATSSTAASSKGPSSAAGQAPTARVAGASQTVTAAGMASPTTAADSQQQGQKGQQGGGGGGRMSGSLLAVFLAFLGPMFL